MRTCLIVIAFALSVTACNKVDSEKLEKDVEAQLAEGGITGADVTCPKDVKAKKGATFTCDIKIGEKTYQYDVEITAVDGSDLELNTAFRDGTAFPREKILELLTPAVKEKIGVDPTIDCGTDPLMFAADGKIYCSIAAEAQKGKLRIDVKDAEITGWEIEAN
jgi:hypothetical protein